MSKVVDRFDESFATETKDALVTALQQAYESNFTRYDPNIGHDEMTYGLMIYKSVCHFLVQAADIDSAIKITARTPYFCMQIGHYVVSPYKAGYSGDSVIEDSFPKNRNRAWRLAVRNKQAAQLSLFGEEPEPDYSVCQDLVLAHIGNPNDGLLTVFLGIPIEGTVDKQITKWAETYVIWTSENFGSAASDGTGQPPTPIEEIVPPPLSLKDEVITPPVLTAKNEDENRKSALKK